MLLLTHRQKQIYEFIKQYIRKNDYAPSLEEIKKHFKLKSVSTIHEHIETLQTKGFLEKTDNQARAINIFESEPMVQIDILGNIAAGQPIEAIADRQETIAVPKINLPRSGEFFGLRVSGDSMIDENINDGDIVIIKKQPSADDGDRVVALINNHEVTLKKIYKEKGKIKLQPANPKIKPIFINPNNLIIQGIVIDIIKNITEEKETKKETSVERYKKLPLNKIILGDAIDEFKKLPSKSVDLIIADPPYNLSKGQELKWKKNNNFSGFGGNWNKAMEAWDNMSLSDYFNFSFLWINEIKRILKETGSIWVFGTYHNIGIINTIFQLLNIEIINEVIWYKRNAFPNLRGRRLTASHETLLWGHVGQDKRKYYFDYQRSKSYHNPSDLLKQPNKQMRTVWDIPNNKKADEIKFGKHPTQKPLSVCNRIIQISTKKDDIVLSPFSGAGTECVSAKSLGRNYIGFEIDNKYINIANKRLNYINSNKLL